MRILLQRVRSASVFVGEELVGQIGPGLLALVGVTHDDTEAVCRRMAEKTLDLRIFEDVDGRMNRSIREFVGEGSGHGILVVSQFTLYADARKGRRPSFKSAASPELAAPLVELFASQIRDAGALVQQGRFGAEMLVRLENDGPVTIWLDSRDLTG
jgi:D-tyrosyl-tRNA(Tyr) deacylase